MITIGMILFEGITQLDLTGPYEIFSRLPGTRILLLAKDLRPLKSENGINLLPTETFKNCREPLDILFVPGGRGISHLMADAESMNFIIQKGIMAKYVTAVCTGSLVLAAAGLLQGYTATTHWLSMDLLKKFGIATSTDRVVVDRDRITGGGVTSGIDLALIIASRLFGEEKAKEIQLLIEYHPQPPFNSGHPSVADKSLVEKVTNSRKEIQRAREVLIDTLMEKRAQE